MKRLFLAVVLSAMAGAACAGNLCSVNPFTKAEAEKGRIAFNSHCALCHQYDMTGRQPGNSASEFPDINLLSEQDLKFIDGNVGLVPPLVGEKFFKKQQALTLVDFTSQVGGASNSFPTIDFGKPKTYLLLAAYVLYRNCGRM